jgi:hypothetical protein
MNVNATIFIQIINFCVVYWLLRNLLFRPVITVIDSELSDKVALTNFIDQQKKSIEIQEKNREHHWYECREYFKAHRPQDVRHAISSAIQTRDSEEIDNVQLSKERDQLVANVYTVLEEKIKNVH